MTLNTISDSNIPDTIRDIQQWICWREEERDGKPTKIPTKPYDTSGSPNARSDEPSHWRDFDTALTYHREGRTKTDGVGFVFSTETEIVGVDLDSCRDSETGDLDGWAQDIVERLDSYTEVSPSGTGVHVLVTGQLPDGRNRRGEIEMYDDGRFFTVTGEHVDGTPLDIHRRQDAIIGVHLDYVQTESDDDSQAQLDEQATDTSAAPDVDSSNERDPGSSPVITERSGLRRKFGRNHPTIEDPAVEAALHNTPPTKIPIPIPQTFDDLAGPGVPLDDQEVLNRAFASKSGENIEALFNGDPSLFEGTDSRYPSQSEADMALLFYLAFWTGKDPEQMERLFRESSLMRPKWDRRHYGNGATYGGVCLARTLIEVTDHYEPPASEGSSGNAADRLWGDDNADAQSSQSTSSDRFSEPGASREPRSSESTSMNETGGSRVTSRPRRPGLDMSATEDARRLALKVKQQHERLAEQATYIADLEARLRWYREALGIDPPLSSGSSSYDRFSRGTEDVGRHGMFDEFSMNVGDVDPPGQPPPAPERDLADPPNRFGQTFQQDPRVDRTDPIRTNGSGFEDDSVRHLSEPAPPESERDDDGSVPRSSREETPKSGEDVTEDDRGGWRSQFLRRLFG